MSDLNQKKIRKAVIPAAGLGTRFLPITKAQPKEMLPLIDTPVIHYVVEEALAAGLDDILIITGSEKRAIEDYFDRNVELETELRNRGQMRLLDEVEKHSAMADLHYVRQKRRGGLGDALRYARRHVGDEPFVVLLGDTLIRGPESATQQILEKQAKFGGSVVAVERVPLEKTYRYGIIKGEMQEQDLFRLSGVVEKPRPEKAPSTMAIAGRYVLTPAIFDEIDKLKTAPDQEIQLADAMDALCKKEPMYAWRFDGVRYDIGNKLDYMKALIEFGVQRRDIGSEIRRFIKAMASKLPNEGKQ